MTLVAISGSQGSGKTILLKKLEELGHNVISRKTSRSILSEWNVTLEAVNNDPDLTLKFQQEIIQRKYKDEDISHFFPKTFDVFEQAYNYSQPRKEEDIWFTERTYADLMTYFLIALGKTNRFSPDINDYYKECIKFQQTYDKVFYLKAGHFIPENDDIRGANIHYSRMTDLAMLDITYQMTPGDKLNVIHTPCLDQRLQIILAHCGLLK